MSELAEHRRLDQIVNGTYSPWAPRLKLLMRALGWPPDLLAENLGIGARGVKKLMEGRVPSVDALLRLQALESLYAREIENQRQNPKRRTVRAILWPPVWVGCRKRWWVGGVQHVVAARPADLATLGADSPGNSAVLSGHYDARNFPGRAFKMVDWTAAGRAQFAANFKAKPRQRKVVTRGPGNSFVTSYEQGAKKK